MNKMVIASTMLVSLFAANSMAAVTPVAGSASHASTTSNATAKVDFTGEIVASTCVVNTSATDKTVALPKVNDQQFGTTSGFTTGDTQFTLSFKECKTIANHGYFVDFSGKTPTGDTTVLEATRTTAGTGTTAAATDVGIQVADTNGTAIDFGPGKTELPMANNATGDLTLNLIAKYEQLTNAIPAPGQLTASMNYTVIYK